MRHLYAAAQTILTFGESSFFEFRKARERVAGTYVTFPVRKSVPVESGGTGRDLFMSLINVDPGTNKLWVVLELVGLVCLEVAMV